MIKITLLEQMREIYSCYTGQEIAQAIRTIRVELDALAQKESIQKGIETLKAKLVD